MPNLNAGELVFNYAYENNLLRMTRQKGYHLNWTFSSTTKTYDGQIIQPSTQCYWDGHMTSPKKKGEQVLLECKARKRLTYTITGETTGQLTKLNTNESLFLDEQKEEGILQANCFGPYLLADFDTQTLTLDLEYIHLARERTTGFLFHRKSYDNTKETEERIVIYPRHPYFSIDLSTHQYIQNLFIKQ